MAANSYDATTGRPIFVDTDPPDIKVDPTQAALYAADVGNRIIRANLAALQAYAYKRKGLTGIALDTLITYVYDGSGWVTLTSTWVTGWSGLTAASGWTANGGAAISPRVSREGYTVTYQGGFFNGTANTTATTLPDWARPSREIRVHGALAADAATPVTVRIFANGAFQPSGPVVHTTSSLMWSVL